MSAQQATPIEPKIKAQQLLIGGKVIRVRSYNGHFYTTLICPAPDQYSRPDVLEIRSQRRFGDVDQELTAKVRIGGFNGRPYTFTDKETGERRTQTPVTLTLDLVD
jgi:hypothetical protein